MGRGGSGTVFFSHCGLRCVFCIRRFLRGIRPYSEVLSGALSPVQPALNHSSQNFVSRKKTGAAKQIESIRSNKPPWPSTRVP